MKKQLKLPRSLITRLLKLPKYCSNPEGIQCFLSGENFAVIYWLYTNANGGINLYVKESERQKAREILKKIYSPDAANADPNYDLKCVKCGSSDIDYIKYSRWMFAISLIFLPFMFTLPRKIFKCNACGHKWRIPKF